MSDDPTIWAFLRRLTWNHVWLTLAVLVAAGLAAVLENAYQPGDWIELKGVYGEVKAIDLRAVRLVTADDTEVVIPHSAIWSSAIANATSGNRGLLCVALFYLEPDHDAAAARRK